MYPPKESYPQNSQPKFNKHTPDKIKQTTPWAKKMHSIFKNNTKNHKTIILVKGTIVRIYKTLTKSQNSINLLVQIRTYLLEKISKTNKRTGMFIWKSRVEQCHDNRFHVFFKFGWMTINALWYPLKDSLDS